MNDRIQREAPLPGCGVVAQFACRPGMAKLVECNAENQGHKERTEIRDQCGWVTQQFFVQEPDHVCWMLAQHGSRLACRRRASPANPNHIPPGV